MITLNFFNSKTRDENTLKTHFSSFANQIADNVRQQLQSDLLTLDAMSVGVTTQVAHSEDKLSWPLVTIPDFAAIGWTARQQMKAESIGLLPLVSNDVRSNWEDFVIENQDWIEFSRQWEREKEESQSSSSGSRKLRRINDDLEPIQTRNDLFLGRTLIEEGEATDFSKGISNRIYTLSASGEPIVDEGSGPFTPIWITSPAPPHFSTINFNLLSHPLFQEAINNSIGSQHPVLSKVLNFDSKHFTISDSGHHMDPVSAFYYPVFDIISSDQTMVGLLASEVSWTRFFEGILPSSTLGIICVYKNSCDQEFTYRLDGSEATFLGFEDLHDKSFDHLVESKGLSYLLNEPGNFAALQMDYEYCPFELRIYPSDTFAQEYMSREPALFAVSVAVLFVISASILFLGRNKHDKDVSSVVVLERDFSSMNVNPSFMARFWSFCNESNVSLPHFKATLRPRHNPKQAMNDNAISQASVVFVDILGLEKWSTGKDSEERDNIPQAVQNTFSSVAKLHGVTQVEIAGNSFVAVMGASGLNNYDHASAMIEFSCDCRCKILELFQRISASNVSVRFGIHSGYLQSSDMQDTNYALVGDTVETAFELLGNSKPNKILVSVDTAELLTLAGKSAWMSRRKGLIKLKGKGTISTYWIRTKHFGLTNSDVESLANSTDNKGIEWSLEEEDTWDEPQPFQNYESKFESMVDRNVMILLPYLKKIISKRVVTQKYSDNIFQENEMEMPVRDQILEESRELVRMPPFEPKLASHKIGADLAFVSEEVKSELRLLVSSIASSYKSNAFHNFEHATHVALTMDKMLQKATSPNETDKTYLGFNGKQMTAEDIALELDARSFGIASDPLTEFALMYSALVHDIDHLGVSNYQLVKEECPIATVYKNKSVAEQNSIDMGWWLLMTPNFATLRQTIFSNMSEKKRFRQLLVNSVVATDILDRDLKLNRDKRWNKAFRKKTAVKFPEKVRLKDLQATMVIEHLLQAADSGHTMQNFQTYLKWNERLFEEMYTAYNDGRAEHDPSLQWYVAELAYFDKFVIPLATRLSDCGVFGDSGSDYLIHAMENRKLWKERGKDLVSKMLERYTRKVVANQDDMIVFS